MFENLFQSTLLLRKRELDKVSRLFSIRLSSSSSKEVWKTEINKPHKAEELIKPLPDCSVFETVSIPKLTLLELHKYNPLTIPPQRIRELKDQLIRNYEIYQQRYIQERHEILGSDLAAAHFIVYRGGKVKFHNHDYWIGKNEDDIICDELPNSYVRNMYLECIDASNTKIRYEGLVNMTNLNKLKWLSLRNCPFVDDWFLDRISGEFSDTLEYLDISDCSNVTEHGLNGFYRFRNLKKIVVNNIVKNLSFEFRLFLLEDTIPNLKVEGIKYMEIN